MASSTMPSGRIVSLDQFRGYTVAGMFLVNFIGDFAVIPAAFKHHNTYCSYADTIMPQFFFAVGFAYRLAFLRRLQKHGQGPAYRHAIGRCLGLILIGAMLYGLDGAVGSWAQLKRVGPWGFLTTAFTIHLFQALVHIGVTSLWVLPVIASAPRVRVAFLMISGLAHLVISYVFYYDWALTVHVIDGGPLGFMTWTIPLLVGSLAYDVVTMRGPRAAVRPLLLWSIVLMASGYAVSCLNAIHHSLVGTTGFSGLSAWLVEPPFIPPSRPIDLWTMNQRAGSISYLVFAAGFSLAVYVLFLILSDIGSVRIGLFRTLGSNALAAYITHNIVANAIAAFAPKDSPLWYATATFALFFGITYLFIRSLEKQGIYLRL